MTYTRSDIDKLNARAKELGLNLNSDLTATLNKGASDSSGTPAPSAGTGSDSNKTTNLEGLFGSTPADSSIRAYYESTPKTQLDTAGEQGIREKVATSMQDRLDAINQYYNDLVKQNQPSYQSNIGSARALAARSGMLGTQMGESQIQGARQQNQANTATIEAKRSADMATVWNNIDTRANTLIDKANTEADTNSKAYLDYMKTSQDSARKDLITLAGIKGTSLDNLSKQDLDTILKQTGYTKDEATLVFNQAKSASEKIAWADKPVETKDGKLVFYGNDPTTNTVKTVTIDANIPQGYSAVMSSDGTLYYKNDTDGSLIPAPLGSSDKTEDIKNFNYAKSQGYKGTFTDYQKQQANLKDTTSTASEQLKTTKSQVADEISKALGGVTVTPVEGQNYSQMENKTGKYLTADQWNTLRNQWISQTSYTPAQFDDAFRSYIDPTDPSKYNGFEEYGANFVKKSTIW